MDHVCFKIGGNSKKIWPTSYFSDVQHLKEFEENHANIHLFDARFDKAQTLPKNVIDLQQTFRNDTDNKVTDMWKDFKGSAVKKAVNALESTKKKIEGSGKKIESP